MNQNYGVDGIPRLKCPAAIICGVTTSAVHANLVRIWEQILRFLCCQEKKEHHSSLSSLSLGPPRMRSTFEAKFHVWSPKWKEKESVSAQTVLQMSLYLVYKNYFRDFPWNSPNMWWESTSLVIFLPWYVLCTICRNLPKTLPAEGSSRTTHVGAHVDKRFPAACYL